jgi:hypothetical protein
VLAGKDTLATALKLVVLIRVKPGVEGAYTPSVVSIASPRSLMASQPSLTKSVATGVGQLLFVVGIFLVYPFLK